MRILTEIIGGVVLLAIFFYGMIYIINYITGVIDANRLRKRDTIEPTEHGPN